MPEYRVSEQIVKEVPSSRKVTKLLVVPRSAVTELSAVWPDAAVSEKPEPDRVASFEFPVASGHSRVAMLASPIRYQASTDPRGAIGVGGGGDHGEALSPSSTSPSSRLSDEDEARTSKGNNTHRSGSMRPRVARLGPGPCCLLPARPARPIQSSGRGPPLTKFSTMQYSRNS